MKTIRSLLVVCISSVGFMLLASCGGGGDDDGGGDGTNSAPSASAGVAQSVVTATTVTLNGSTSSDANSDSLTYSWILTSRPAGSTAALSNAMSVMPTFVADIAGTYIAMLVVNDGQTSSAPATVMVSAAASNAAPVANAGPAQSVVIGATVTLNGSASSDANGDPLTYIWTLISKPTGSSAILSNSSSVLPMFVADLAGSYVARLTVNDGQSFSAPATVTINVADANLAPTAGAGPAQKVASGTLVTLSGHDSRDANGDSLVYRWTLTSKPSGSGAVLNKSASVEPTFVADVLGLYVVTLVVDDGQLSSVPATVVVSAATAVSGLLSGSVRWDKASSPYVLTGDVLIPTGSALIIPAGVEIRGEGHKIQTEGSFRVEGTMSDQVVLDDVDIEPAGLPPSHYLVSVSRAILKGGRFFGTNTIFSYGTLALTDSVLIDQSSHLYLLYPVGVNVIDRNVFSGSGIAYSVEGSASVSIQNNRFVSWPGGFKQFAVENRSDSSTATSIVAKNSFLSTDRVAIRLNSNFAFGKIDVANNYWGTTSTAVIDQMIFDRNDDLNESSFINYMPFLTQPDALTP